MPQSNPTLTIVSLGILACATAAASSHAQVRLHTDFTQRAFNGTPSSPLCYSAVERPSATGGEVFFISPNTFQSSLFGEYTLFKADSSSLVPIAQVAPLYFSVFSSFSGTSNPPPSLMLLQDGEQQSTLLIASPSTLVESDGTPSGTRILYVGQSSGSTPAFPTPSRGNSIGQFLNNRLIFLSDASGLSSIRRDSTDLRPLDTSLVHSAGVVRTELHVVGRSQTAFVVTSDGLSSARIDVPLPLVGPLRATRSHAFAMLTDASLARTDGTVAGTSIIAHNVDTTRLFVQAGDAVVFSSRPSTDGASSLFIADADGVRQVTMPAASLHADTPTRVIPDGPNKALLFAATRLTSGAEDIFRLNLTDATAIQLSTRAPSPDRIADMHETAPGSYRFTVNVSDVGSQLYSLMPSATTSPTFQSWLFTAGPGPLAGLFMGKAGDSLVVPLGSSTETPGTGYEPHIIRPDGTRFLLGNLVSEFISNTSRASPIAWRSGVALFRSERSAFFLDPDSSFLQPIQLPADLTYRFPEAFSTCTPTGSSQQSLLSFVSAGITSPAFVARWSSPTVAPTLIGPFTSVRANQRANRPTFVFTARSDSRPLDSVFALDNTLSTAIPLTNPNTSFGFFESVRRNGQSETLLSQETYLTTDATVQGTSSETLISGFRDARRGAVSLRAPNGQSSLGVITASDKVLRRDGPPNDPLSTDAGLSMPEIANLSSIRFPLAMPSIAHPERDDLWFTARRDTSAGLQHFLVRTDFTVDGTQILLQLPGEPVEAVTIETPQGRRIFFVITHPTQGRDLYTSDGTQAGTLRMTSVRANGASFPLFLESFGPFVLFTADDGIHGREVWTSFGTSSSTRMIADLEPGPVGIAVQPRASLEVPWGLRFVRTPTAIVFAAHTSATGTEYFSFPIPSRCDPIDFNNDGIFPSDDDLISFLAVLAGSSCDSCNDLDFDNDDIAPSDDDLLAFLRVLAGGSC
jgi:ELWxxDGT repeat protein